MFAGFLIKERSSKHSLNRKILLFCFGRQAERIQSVEIGDYDFWTKYSDHVPLIVTKPVKNWVNRLRNSPEVFLLDAYQAHKS